MKRSKTSHKGQNGRVLIIGGSERYHGAPILSALAAEQTGIDLTYLMVPANQQNLTRNYSLNLIVDTFKGKYLRPLDVQHILDWSRKVDVVVIGPGLGDNPKTLRALKKILQKAPSKLVIDAAALAVVADCAPFTHDTVLTPHSGEWKKMMKAKNGSKTQIEAELKQKSNDWKATIVLKGPEDLIVSPGEKTHRNKSGHPIMTKGGTGDILAGLIGGLMAQGLSGFEAAKQATKVWGEVGEKVARQKGLMVTVAELLRQLK